MDNDEWSKKLAFKLAEIDWRSVGTSAQEEEVVEPFTFELSLAEAEQPLMRRLEKLSSEQV